MKEMPPRVIYLEDDFYATQLETLKGGYEKSKKASYSESRLIAV